VTVLVLASTNHVIWNIPAMIQIPFQAALLVSPGKRLLPENEIVALRILRACDRPKPFSSRSVLTSVSLAVVCACDHIHELDGRQALSLIPEILFLVEQIRPRTTQIYNLRASVSVLLQACTLEAVEGI
jgi:hypothetical protein